MEDLSRPSSVSDEKMNQLKLSLSKLDATPDKILAAAQIMLDLSKSGFTNDCVEIWTEYEAQSKDDDKLPFYYTYFLRKNFII